MRYQTGLWLTVLILVSARLVGGAQPPKDLVQATLLADVSSVEPGQAFSLGVHLEMKPGWHIYWHNPGEAGLATSVQLELPEGVTAGPLRWPAPTRFNQPGDILGYGYSEPVLLGAEVGLPGTLSGGSSVQVRAKVRWLSCEEVCIPGSATLELSLPVSSSRKPANSSLFAEWTASLPVPVDAGSARGAVQASVAGALLENAGDFTLSLTFKEAPKSVEWFPHAVKGLRIGDVSIRTEGSRTNITFQATVMKGRELSSDELSSVVVYVDPQGNRRAVQVQVPFEK
jgi:DsbC/DsbD-like thiol-disulfide interchange protein